jgi:CheY-like chemotaxis protein
MVLKDIAATLTKPVKESALFDTLANLLATSGRGDIGRPEEPDHSHDHPEVQEAHQTAVRILVAEDNSINQKVALRMLEKLGYRADVVANGREAVEALKQMPYDLILMDCNMPEMDGFDATAIIRDLEKDEKHTVIVAMTANALRGDRDRALAAGMDDYIAKPVSQRELAALIRAWAAKIRGNGNGTHNHTAPSTDARELCSHEVLDHQRLAELKDLAADEKAGWLRELVQEYLADAARRLGELHEAIESGDVAAVGRIAHALKGSSRNLGIVNVVPACEKLQAAGESGIRETFPDLLEQLAKELTRAKTELERLGETPAAVSTISTGAK